MHFNHLTVPDHKPQQEEIHLVRRLHLGRVYHHSNQLIDKTKNESFLNKWNQQSELWHKINNSLIVQRKVYFNKYIALLPS